MFPLPCHSLSSWQLLVIHCVCWCVAASHQYHWLSMPIVPSSVISTNCVLKMSDNCVWTEHVQTHSCHHPLSNTVPTTHSNCIVLYSINNLEMIKEYGEISFGYTQTLCHCVKKTWIPTDFVLHGSFLESILLEYWGILVYEFVFTWLPFQCVYLFKWNYPFYVSLFRFPSFAEITSHYHRTHQ